jgi:pyrroline-5-carboxylate reductase
MSSILIVGAGNMGGALAKGLVDATHVGLKVRLFDIHQGRLDELARRLPVAAISDLSADSVDDDVVALCVKPQDLVTVAGALRGRIAGHAMVVSILAGVTIADVQQSLEFDGAVVRAMPNIAATVHAAATALCASPECSDRHRDLAMAIFRAIGDADWTKESLLDAVTGLSGSGPAYVYMVIESLTDGGVKMGIPRALASRLATQTVLGAAQLVKETGLHPAVLRDQVTTPGGTTINAIHELEDRGLRAMLISAVETATKRAALLRSK